MLEVVQVVKGGRDYPAVEQDDDGFTAACPYCGERHRHGTGENDEPMSHRVAHCTERGPENVGYYLLRPRIDGLLNLPCKWWRESPPAGIGLGGVGLAGGVGSLIEGGN